MNKLSAYHFPIYQFPGSTYLKPPDGFMVRSIKIVPGAPIDSVVTSKLSP